MMTPEKRAELQAAWKKRGNPPCKHKKTEGAGGLERKVCTVCGAICSKRMKPGIDFDDDDPPPEDD